MKSLMVYSTQLMETGGIESHLLEFCQQMNSKDIAIDLLVLNSLASPETEEAYLKVCRNVYFGKQKNVRLRLMWFFIIGFTLRFKKYDALYTNGQGNSIGLLAKMLKIKDTWVHHHHTSGDKDDQATWGANYIKALMNADMVIACSARNAGDMEKVLGRAIDTIPCFSRKIDIDTVAANKSGKVKFGYYGRLIPEKGIDILCKMSEEKDFQDIEFHIWGEGIAYSPSFFKQYPKVNYHGTFSGLNGLTAAIASIDAFLLLSAHPEGLPISLLEAMSVGLPWLATDKGGIPDIACDPVSTRMISSNADYTTMKKAVKLFADDIGNGKVSRDSQKQLYRERFSANALTKRWKSALGLVKKIN